MGSRLSGFGRTEGKAVNQATAASGRMPMVRSGAHTEAAVSEALSQYPIAAGS